MVSLNLGGEGQAPSENFENRLAEIAFPYILCYETNINLTTLFSV